MIGGAEFDSDHNVPGISRRSLLQAPLILLPVFLRPQIASAREAPNPQTNPALFERSLLYTTHYFAKQDDVFNNEINKYFGNSGIKDFQLGLIKVDGSNITLLKNGITGDIEISPDRKTILHLEGWKITIEDVLTGNRFHLDTSVNYVNWSPDGQSVTFRQDDHEGDRFSQFNTSFAELDLATKKIRKLVDVGTDPNNQLNSPLFSPDKKYLAYAANFDGWKGNAAFISNFDYSKTPYGRTGDFYVDQSPASWAKSLEGSWTPNSQFFAWSRDNEVVSVDIASQKVRKFPVSAGWDNYGRMTNFGRLTFNLFGYRREYDFSPDSQSMTLSVENGRNLRGTSKEGLVSVNLTSGDSRIWFEQERNAKDWAAYPLLSNIKWSPDGQFLMFKRRDDSLLDNPATLGYSFSFINAANGDFYTMPGSHIFQDLDWMP